MLVFRLSPYHVLGWHRGRKAMHAKRFGRLFGFVPGYPFGSVENTVLMTLAGQHHGVSSPSPFDRGCDGRATVLDAAVIAPFDRSGGLGAAGDIPNDRLGIFKAWVLRGKDREISQLSRYRALKRPLGRITLTGTAEHRAESTSRQALDEAQRLLKRIRSVRVVDDDGKGLPLVNTQEPPRNAGKTFEARRNLIRRHPQPITDTGRGERVLDVERPDQTQMGFAGSIRRDQPEARPVIAVVYRFSSDTGGHVSCAEPDHRRCSRVVSDGAGAFVVAIQDDTVRERPSTALIDLLQ